LELRNKCSFYRPAPEWLAILLPRVLIKLDLARAFDSLSWPFLFEALRRYGFGARFLDWLAILLTSASTRVLLNGEPGPAIWHRRGLHQGDPLSPQLFVLAVDTLGRLFCRATELGVLRQLHARRLIPSISLYADDVIPFCHPLLEEVEAVKELLKLFGRASGLCANYNKSTATLIKCAPAEVEPAVARLACPIVDLPLNYLGIPLTIRKPTSAQMQLVVDRIANRLPTSSNSDDTLTNWLEEAVQATPMPLRRDWGPLPC
jgi:hypothetical protein